MRRRRRRHLLPDEDRRALLHRGRRAARRQVRRPPAPRGGRRPRRPAARAAAPAAGRGQQGRPDVLRRPAGDARSRHRPPVPGRARVRPGGGRAVRPRLRAARRRGAAASPAPAGLPRRGVRRRRAGRSGPVGVRPVPRPAAVADPRRERRHDRLRGTADLRRRQDRGEVPQHSRDDPLQEEPRALRHRPGQARHGPHLPGGGRRGLHRRDGLPPLGCADRRGHLRNLLRRRPRPGAASVPPRPRGVPRRGDLHLRRRRSRPEGRPARVRRRPELRLPDLRRRRAHRPRPLRPAHPAGRRCGPRAGRAAGAALPLRAQQRRVASTTSTAPTAASTPSARPPGWSPRSATSPRSTRSRASWPA